MKNEIKCPKCGEVFQVDESGYAEILAQIKAEEIEHEVARRLNDAKTIAQKEAEIAKGKAEADRKEVETRLLAEIAALQAKIDGNENEKKLAVSQEKSEQEKRIAEKDAAIVALKAELEKQKVQADADKKEALNVQTAEIERLKGEIKNAGTVKDSAVEKAVAEKQIEITKLQSELETQKANAEKERLETKDANNALLKEKDDQIAYYKDLKQKLSTKMIGETLEQHCMNSFETIRPVLPENVYFEKDNDAKSGSKGDFIYREYDQDGVELLSIMFEMKNEADATATKHRNEHFFNELNKDREEKKCEYAILVSLLERDSDLYNGGIVDVSRFYKKMYVIRPQFFLPIITLLRNMALRSADVRHELATLKSQNVDVTNFESKLQEFQDGFTRNVDLAKKQHAAAIEQIDKAISNLQKVRESLTSSDRNLELADDKVQGLTLRKLTHNNPTMAAAFKEAKEGK